MGTNWMSLKELFVRCDCQMAEHQVIFSYDPNEQEEIAKELYIEPYLGTWFGFLRRFWYGLRYAFGYRSKYGMWDCITIDKEKATKLRNFINEFLES